MSQQKTVSVVIPAFNRASTVLRAVRSALRQTYPVLEVIVVDDCSTDNTVETVEAIGDPRVRVIRNSVNSGACKSRNAGIEAAVGEYIALLDSDDEWMSEKVEKQMAALEVSRADVCTCRFKRSSAESDDVLDGLDGVLPACPPGVLERRELVKTSLVSTQTILAKKEVFENFLFDEEMPRLQDYEWTIRASERYTFFLVDDALVNVYMQNDSITFIAAGKTIEALERVLAKNIEALKDEPEMLSYLYSRLGNTKARLGMESAPLFRESLRLHFSLKIAVKFLLAEMGLYPRKA